MCEKLLIQIQYCGENNDREDETNYGNLCCGRPQPQESPCIKK